MECDAIINLDACTAFFQKNFENQENVHHSMTLKPSHSSEHAKKSDSSAFMRSFSSNAPRNAKKSSIVPPLRRSHRTTIGQTITPQPSFGVNAPEKS